MASAIVPACGKPDSLEDRAVRLLALNQVLFNMGRSCAHFSASFEDYMLKLAAPALLGHCGIGFGDDEHRGQPVTFFAYANVDDALHDRFLQGEFPLACPDDWCCGPHTWITDVIGLQPYVFRHMREWKRIMLTDSDAEVWVHRKGRNRRFPWRVSQLH